ncbi:hypothetical protein BV25DRAFT_1919278 [Artomyces pyxidatus]|uniref:Uncharacterized protein n=1 Tax=Artomyces pyxidatus TaxID=48021 RepID=A0ACB8SPT5_9AGAM|nr:hypothetical protein BV25DRAFT_1919278 [Artomyces pyxidatus]
MGHVRAPQSSNHPAQVEEQKIVDSAGPTHDQEDMVDSVDTIFSQSREQLMDFLDIADDSASGPRQRDTPLAHHESQSERVPSQKRRVSGEHPEAKKRVRVQSPAGSSKKRSAETVEHPGHEGGASRADKGKQRERVQSTVSPPPIDDSDCDTPLPEPRNAFKESFNTLGGGNDAQASSSRVAEEASYGNGSVAGPSVSTRDASRRNGGRPPPRPIFNTKSDNSRKSNSAEVDAQGNVKLLRPKGM